MSTPSAAQQETRWRRFAEQARRQEIPFADHWDAYRESFSGRRPEDGPPPVWRPEPAAAAGSNPGRLMAELGLPSWDALHAWSVADRAGFWERAIARLGISFARPPAAILDASGGIEDPRWLPGAELNAAASCFGADPGAPAIVSAGEGDDAVVVTTYGALRRRAERVAAGLRRQGLAPGDAVALYLPMTPDCVAAYLGAVLAGCPVISIADSFPAAELARRLELGDARAVVTVDYFRRGERSIGLYATVREAGGVPAIVIPADPDRPPALARGDLAWSALLAAGAAPPLELGDPYRTTNVLFSSGTTGTPKAIPWDHLTPIKCAADGHFHHDLQETDVVAWPTSIGWMMGPWLIYASLINRATMALWDGTPTGRGFARFIERAGVTVLGVVPSLVRRWRESGALDGADWSRVRLLSSTGEPSNEPDTLWLMSRTGYRAPMIEYCGGTEIGGGYLTGTVVRPAAPATFSTAALGLDFAILDAHGAEPGVGGMGELFLEPPSIGLSQRLLGAAGRAEHRRVYYQGCPRGPRGQVLRRHGDQVRRLGNGYYRALGRADDTMNLAGIKVSSAEIERVLGRHPGVFECAAVAVAPPGGGAEQLVIWAVPAGEVAPEALATELRQRLAAELNPLFRIHRLQLTEALPRTASNKLVRRALRDRSGGGGIG